MSDRFNCLKQSKNVLEIIDLNPKKSKFKDGREVKVQRENLIVLPRGNGGEEEEQEEEEETLEIIKDMVPVKNFLIFKKMKKVVQYVRSN